MKVRLGKMTCRSIHCGGKGHLVHVRQDGATETLSFKCEECGCSTFVKKGELEHKAILSLFAEDESEPAPAAKPAPAPAPERKAFGLGQL